MGTTLMFDPSAPHIIILLVVILLLFGSRRLPGAARSLGQSMHIFKRSVQGMEPADEDTAANPTGQNSMAQPMNSTLPQPAAIAAPDSTGQQLADLQRQVSDLQRQSAGSNGQPAETQTSKPI
jgi:sec-independent protein translocase protein TatA